MRVVLDANVYISALISDKGNPARIVHRWLAGEFDVLATKEINDEILRVSGNQRIQSKYAQVRERRLEFVELISEQGIWIHPSEELKIITADESDNRYLECAITGGAQYIVSGDDHLLDLGEYHGIDIVSPASFLTLVVT